MRRARIQIVQFVGKVCLHSFNTHNFSVFYTNLQDFHVCNHIGPSVLFKEHSVLNNYYCNARIQSVQISIINCTIPIYIVRTLSFRALLIRLHGLHTLDSTRVKPGTRLSKIDKLTFFLNKEARKSLNTLQAGTYP